MRKAIATLTALGALALALAPPAHAVFGDGFGLAPINGHPQAVQPAPGLAGVDDAFWAGTCDTGTAPAPGVAIPGGIGSYATDVLAPDKGGPAPQVPLPVSPQPPHCVEWGAPGGAVGEPGSDKIWNRAPAWRLAPHTQAGGHPDGTAAFAYARNTVNGLTNGSVDNIYVKLPAGFLGDPNAVPKCSSLQFDSSPQSCPVQSQIGVMHLELDASFNGNLGSFQDEKVHPVFNLEPRQGRVAEFGFGYASSESAISVRITGKARTDGDFGIDTFVGQIPAVLPLRSQQITLWGVPWAAVHDRWRAPLAESMPGCTTPLSGESRPHPALIPPTGFTAPGCARPYDPAWGPIKPFISNATQCTGADLTTRLSTDSYQNPGAFSSDGSPHGEKLGPNDGAPVLPDPIDNSLPGWKTYDAPAPAISGCEKLGFDPAITLEPTGPGGAAVTSADSPSGLDVELAIPQNDELPFDPPADGAPQPEVDQYLADATAFWKSDQGLATSHLRDTTVTLPEGMTLNPAAADGQGACSMAQIGVTDTASPEPPRIRFNNAPIACPESSKVGEVVVETPVLDEADWPTGSVYLAQQGSNPFGSDFAIYIAVESPERGLIVKLAGRVSPDPATGRLRTTVTENPQVPFDTFRLRFKGGPRAPLATPQTCGTHTSANSFTPYSAPGSPVAVNDPFSVTSSPAGGCAATPQQRPFNLGFSAGSTDIVAGNHTPFTARFTRGDGNQELDRIELTTPEGFAAKLAGVPYCPDSAIAQAIGRTATGDGALEKSSPSCPAASKVGTTTIGAGAGAQPFYVKGGVYLAGPYRGAPVSLAFIVPAVAGPFDLGVQVVRTALQVNPKTAQVTAVSDTIPKILRGVPLRIRDVRVDVDRPGFTLNPTDCAEQQVTGKVFGASGAVTSVSNRFQVAECARLGFKPKLTLRLKGGTKRSKYQGLVAVVTPRPGDANIARTSVTMPRSAFLAQEHIRTVCTRVQFAAEACPAGSIYGRATAWSPLLDEPLSGNVYLRSSDNKLPDLVTDLRGPARQPIRVELSGRTDSFKGGLRNTFDFVPDAAVTKFELELFGGNKGLIVNSQDLCRKKRHLATVKMGAQNGRTYNFRPVVKNGCTKKQIRKAQEKQKAKKKGQSKQAKRRTVSALSLADLARGLF